MIFQVCQIHGSLNLIRDSGEYGDSDMGCLIIKKINIKNIWQTVPVVKKAVELADEIQEEHDFEFRYGGVVDSEVSMSKYN